MTKQTVDTGVAITSEYDWLGRLLSVTDPKGAKTTNYYDSAGLLIKTDTPFDANVYSTKTYSYDNNGNVTRETVTNGAPGTTKHRGRFSVLTNPNSMIKYAWGDKNAEARAV